MAQQYTNPASLLTPVDFKLTGMAAGAASSLRDQYGLADLQQGMQTQDIANQLNQNRLNNALLDNPNLAAKRSVEAGTTAIEQGNLDNGMTKRINESTNQTVLTKQDLERVVDAGKKAQEGGKAWLEMQQLSDFLRQDPNGALAHLNSPQMQSQIEELKSRAKLANVPFPEGNIMDPAFQATVAAKSRAFLNSAETINKRIADAETHKTQLEIAEKGITRATSVAEINRIAGNEREAARQLGLTKLHDDFLNLIKDPKVKLDAAGLAMVEQIARKEFEELKDNTLMWGTSQRPNETYEDWKKRAIQLRVADKIESFTRAKKEQLSGSSVFTEDKKVKLTHKGTQTDPHDPIKEGLNPLDIPIGQYFIHPETGKVVQRVR